jgi:hypothetical protein
MEEHRAKRLATTKDVNIGVLAKAEIKRVARTRTPVEENTGKGSRQQKDINISVSESEIRKEQE